MSKFKLGDRVRCVNMPNSIGTVCGYSASGRFPFVLWDGAIENYMYYNNVLVLCEEQEYRDFEDKAKDRM